MFKMNSQVARVLKYYAARLVHPLVKSPTLLYFTRADNWKRLDKTATFLGSSDPSEGAAHCDIYYTNHPKAALWYPGAYIRLGGSSVKDHLDRLPEKERRAYIANLLHEQSWSQRIYPVVEDPDRVMVVYTPGETSWQMVDAKSSFRIDRSPGADRKDYMCFQMTREDFDYWSKRASGPGVTFLKAVGELSSIGRSPVLHNTHVSIPFAGFLNWGHLD